MSTSAKEQRPERGPVEEIIAKRLRPLNKKVQRVRGYAAQEHAALNADQKSAVANLPALEGAIRELEELARQVEEAELIAAARERELREAAEREFEARVAARIAEAQLALAARLGGFLSLHALLHPARAADAENLTFAPLDLPPRMADAVLATDILRVGRMYDDILAGGDAAHAVLGGLAAGPSEEDEEGELTRSEIELTPDARVHQLLVLLGQDEVEIEVPETPAAEEEAPEDPAVMVTLEQPASGGLRTTLNFLQEDELALDAQEPAQAEFVIIEPESVPASVPVSNEPAGFDWTAADDDENTAQRLQEAFSTPASADAEAEVEDAAAGIEAVHLSGTATPASDGQGPRKRAPRKRKPHSAKKAGENGAAPAPAAGAEEKERKPQGQGQGQGQQQRKKEGGQNGAGGETRQRKPRNPQGPKKPQADAAPAADDDGFQVQKPKARTAKPATRGRGGRPSAGGDRPAGGNRKEGSKENGGGKPRQQKDQPKEAQPKPSIYKQTQPTGPSSAPLF